MEEIECPIDRTMVKVQKVGNHFYKAMYHLENSEI